MNDNQSNISKTVKALKILDQDLNRTKARSTKLFDKVQEEKKNQITKPCKVAEEVALFLSIRDQLSIQSIDSTKSASRSFNKFMDNFSIIKRLYEEENQSLSYIARWMRMSECNLEHWIHRYYKQLARQSEDSKKKEQREQRLDLIKMSIKNFMNCNKGKWVVIRQMVEFANINYFADQTHLKVNYNDIYSWLKNQMNFGWRNASQRPPRCFQNSLEDTRKIF